MGQQRWSGEFHIVDTRTGKSLESWASEPHAKHFTDVVNEHESRNGRGTPYVVERHSVAWRKHETGGNQSPQGQ